MVKFDENVDYCIYVGGLQSGKSFIFKSMESDSIHFNKKLIPNIINVLSISSIYERTTIVGVHKYITSLKSKLDGCYMLKNDFMTSILKHINDVVRRYDNINIINPSMTKKSLNTILVSHYFTLKLFRDYGITYKEKDILSLPPGDIDVRDFFDEEIKKYQLRIKNPIHKKIDYEWGYEKYKESIERNIYEGWGIKKIFDINPLLDIVDDMEYKVKTKYGF